MPRSRNCLTTALSKLHSIMCIKYQYHYYRSIVIFRIFKRTPQRIDCETVRRIRFPFAKVGRPVSCCGLIALLFRPEDTSVVSDDRQGARFSPGRDRKSQSLDLDGNRAFEFRDNRKNGAKISINLLGLLSLTDKENLNCSKTLYTETKIKSIKLNQ